MNQLHTTLLNSTDESNKISEKGGLHWFHWLIISSSLVLTFFAWYFSSEQVEEKIEQQFLRQANQTVELISERMRKYEDALWSGVATVHSQSHGIDYDEWRRFSSTLRLEKRYPGINGIGVIYSVEPNDLEAFLVSERKARPDFGIFPQHDNGIYLPITYIEPVDANRKAVGLDVAHERNRLQAALAARDSGEAKITGPIVLVQDSEKTPGFLFYTPFYKEDDSALATIAERRENFVGLVYAPFIFNKLLEGTLDQSRRAIDLRIEDNGFILYDEHEEGQADSSYKKEIHVNMNGREWIFSIWSTESFLEQNHSNQPLIILFGGIFIDLLLFALFFIISKRNQQALALASYLTKQHREKTAELEIANAELKEFSYRTSHDLRSPLVSSIGLLGFAIKSIENDKKAKALAGLSHVNNSLQQLQILVEGILDLAKASHLDEPDEPVDLSLMLDDVLMKMQCMENADRIVVHKNITEGTVLTTKKFRFQLVLENLVSNAIKYQDVKKEMSWVNISTEEKDGCFILSVEDNGLGIPEDLQPQMFSMFKRFHANVAQGSGLGLYMMKKSASILRGDMVFSNGKEGVGSKFSLIIKL